jgi:hypothetical protein
MAAAHTCARCHAKNREETMSEKTRPATMLRRLPVILAVTAASYGLPLPAQQAARQQTNLGAKAAAGEPPQAAAQAQMQAG